MDIKTYEQIYEDIKNHVISHQTKVTDFTEGSVVMGIADAVSRKIAELYVNAKIGFTSYMRGLPYTVFGFEPLKGRRATVQVQFGVSNPAKKQIAIPIGTEVSSGSHTFQTTEKTVIPIEGTESGLVWATAQAVGEPYNVAAHTITTINGWLSGELDTVDNPEAAAGGEAKERWNDFVIRFNQYINGLQNTNLNGLITRLTREGHFRSVGIQEHFPMLNGLYNATIYVEDGTGSASQDDLALAKLLIEGNGTVQYPSYRAVGLRFYYDRPFKIALNFDITIDLNAKRAVDVSVEVLQQEFYAMIKQDINAHTIGENYYSAGLVSKIKSNRYVNDVTIHTPAQKLIIPNPDTIFRFGECQIQITMSKNAL